MDLRTSIVGFLAVGALAGGLAARQGEERSHDALGQARAKARWENQRVLLVLTAEGADPSGGLRAAALAEKELARTLQFECRIAALPGSSLAGRALRERLQLGALELPTAALLDGEDRVVAAASLSSFRTGEAFEAERFRAFVAEHACDHADARAVLADALGAARTSERKVLVYFSAPWCGWCHRLESFLHLANVADRLALDYVVAMIDTDRTAEGDAVGRELRGGGRNPGHPWFAILDAEGAVQTTSDGPEGNCGCPAKEPEVKHFLTMLDATRTRMSATDRAAIEAELRRFVDGIVAARTPGPGAQTLIAAGEHVHWGEYRAAFETLEHACEEGLPAEKILSSLALRPLREDPEWRVRLADLLRRRVATHSITLVDGLEPGRPLVLEGQLLAASDGTPLAGVLLQFFHTDAGGEYRPGMDAGGGAGNPRLFGFLRTDAEGRFRVATIYPERYPDSSVPRHVHYRVFDAEGGAYESECFFDDDPLLSEATRKDAPRRGFPIVTLAPQVSGELRGELVVRRP